SLLNWTVVRGNCVRVAREGDAADLADNLRWIKEARRQADWVIFHFHSHEYGHASLVSAKAQSELSEPSDFARTFARAAIDAGVDIFIGHGSHTPLGIEFYKDKPIFYSVGNLIMENETLPFFPSVACGRLAPGPAAPPAAFPDARTGNGKKGHVAEADFWQIFPAPCHYRAGKLAEIRIHPLDQGFGRP